MGPISEEASDYYTRKTMPVTKADSILFTREWVKKAIEDGNNRYIPRLRMCDKHSIGELIADIYFVNEVSSKQDERLASAYSKHR